MPPSISSYNKPHRTRTPPFLEKVPLGRYAECFAYKAARAEYSKVSATLNQLEEAMHILKITRAHRTLGRKPSGYEPVRSVQDVLHSMLMLITRLESLDIRLFAQIVIALNLQLFSIN